MDPCWDLPLTQPFTVRKWFYFIIYWPYPSSYFTQSLPLLPHQESELMAKYWDPICYLNVLLPSLSLICGLLPILDLLQVCYTVFNSSHYCRMYCIGFSVWVFWFSQPSLIKSQVYLICLTYNNSKREYPVDAWGTFHTVNINGANNWSQYLGSFARNLYNTFFIILLNCSMRPSVCWWSKRVQTLWVTRI